MKLKVLGSSSHGNCYVLENAAEALIIEAGIKPQAVKKALGWNIRKSVACIVTHEHNDHAGYVREIADAGITVLAIPPVFSSHGMTGHAFAKYIRTGKAYRVGGFTVQPVPVTHDVPCVAYIVRHADMGKLLFVTDAVTFPYRVEGLNTVMIEANYSDGIVAENIASGLMPEAMRPRLMCSHMELEETKSVLTNNNLKDVNNIVLLHLSNNNSDKFAFENEIRQMTGIPTTAAYPGLTVDVSLKPY